MHPQRAIALKRVTSLAGTLVLDLKSACALRGRDIFGKQKDSVRKKKSGDITMVVCHQKPTGHQKKEPERRQKKQ
jgi:hypothetical protein